MQATTMLAVLAAAGAAAGFALEYAAPGVAARGWLALERARARLRVRRAAIPGFAMPYLDGGHGEPLVLVHGFGGDKDNFTRIARFLTPHFHVVAPDLPGFGDAARDPDADYGIGAQVERLHAFLQALGLGRVHLGGNSMGGFIAMQYAATYPDDVRSLWLLDAAGTAAAGDTELLRQYAATGEFVLLVRSEADFAALLQAALHRAPWTPPSLRRVLARRATADFALHRRIFRQISSASPSLEPLLPSISAPCLIVWGREDRILNPAAAGIMQALIPQCAVVVMDDTGHLPMIERPRATARDFLRFVAARPG